MEILVVLFFLLLVGRDWWHMQQSTRLSSLSQNYHQPFLPGPLRSPTNFYLPCAHFKFLLFTFCEGGLRGRTARHIIDSPPVALGSQVISTGFTDSNGTFHLPWRSEFIIHLIRLTSPLAPVPINTLHSALSGTTVTKQHFLKGISKKRSHFEFRISNSTTCFQCFRQT